MRFSALSGRSSCPDPTVSVRIACTFDSTDADPFEDCVTTILDVRVHPWSPIAFASPRPECVDMPARRTFDHLASSVGAFSAVSFGG